jgi:DNA mismatch endonuclease (patch repair protein)
MESMRRPAASSYNALRTMQSNRRISGLETRFRRSLWAAGVRGYRLHGRLPGRPDLVFGQVKLAVFIHGCFWHQCPKGHLPAPKANAGFWEQKFRENRLRDRAAVDSLTAMGWNVMTLWECDLRQDTAAMVEAVRERVQR